MEQNRGPRNKPLHLQRHQEQTWRTISLINGARKPEYLED
jgi:hypothetical protein